MLPDLGGFMHLTNATLFHIFFSTIATEEVAVYSIPYRVIIDYVRSSSGLSQSNIFYFTFD